MEPRSQSLTVNIEPLLFEQLQKILAGRSISSYMRSLVIEDLRQKKVLTEHEWMKLLS